MSQPLVSIIVPVYKVEPYLRRCLDSIVNQTYSNLEIVLVDDGSPDNCPLICDEYAAKDERIVVIHKENGGLSDARNAGIGICKGEYVSFVDSDDWISEFFVEILLRELVQNSADVSIANYERVTDLHPSMPPKRLDMEIEVLNSRQSIEKLWSKGNTTFIISCGKIYKASLFAGIRFPKGKIHEDEYTTYKLLYRSKKSVFLDVPLYFYFQRNDSIMASARPDVLNILDAMIERYQFFKKNNESHIMGLCLQDLCWDILFAYSQCNINPALKKYTRCSLLELYHSAVLDYESTKFTKHLFFFKFFARFPWMYTLYQSLSPFKIRKK